jgi:hypothetical protein
MIAPAFASKAGAKTARQVGYSMRPAACANIV